MQQAKVLLRRRMKAMLQEMPSHLILKKSELLVMQCLHLKEFLECASLCIYLSLPSEPCTLQLIQNALHAGKRVYVPQIVPPALQPEPDRAMRMCRLHNFSELGRWRQNKWGIKEPPLPLDKQNVVDEAILDGGVDLIIVPGLAFTQSGCRLGRGGGFYDTYLNWYRAHAIEREIKFPRLIALAFEEQILDKLPMEPHDNVVDKIITA